jgi:glycosyltransferase involved in cell wall biosynthesis
VSPSYFLKQRYVDWGIDADKISVIENGQPPAEKLPPRPIAEGEARLRFAYFGQLSPFKGLDVLLESLDHLPKEVKKKVSIHIHGTPLEQVPEEFRNKIKPLIEKHKKNVTFYGPYETKDLPKLMADIDWVVMPSVWWENSPLVIQEAFKFGRPLIVSDIGGMAEKVTDHVNGLHFRASSTVDLATTVTRIFYEESLWNKLSGSLPSPTSNYQAVEHHFKFYTVD